MSANKPFQLLERFTCHGFYPIAGKHMEQSAILPVSVNMAVLRIVMIVRIPESGNRKNLTIFRTSRNQALAESSIHTGNTCSEVHTP